VRRGSSDDPDGPRPPHEQRFGRGAFGIEAAMGHRLAATGLIARIDHLVPAALEELERRDANLGKEGI
jgi:hypothetical protein